MNYNNLTLSSKQGKSEGDSLLFYFKGIRNEDFYISLNRITE